MGDPLPVPGALDRATGNILWTSLVGPEGGSLGCTPTVDGDRVYALGQGGDLVCIDAAGKRVWHRHLVNDFGGVKGGWNYCESPLVDGDRLIVTPGGKESRIGTNPLCLGVPTRGEPVVLDIGTSVCAEGKVRVLFNKGQPVPEGWLLDAEGRPTTAPMAMPATMAAPWRSRAATRTRAAAAAAAPAPAASFVEQSERLANARRIAEKDLEAPAVLVPLGGFDLLEQSVGIALAIAAHRRATD